MKLDYLKKLEEPKSYKKKKKEEERKRFLCSFKERSNINIKYI